MSTDGRCSMFEEISCSFRLQAERRGFMRRLVAILSCVTLIAPSVGCASGGGTRILAQPQPGVADTAAMADYVQRLPAGSKVRVERTDGTSLRGTLMRAGSDAIVVQKNTRIPEQPVEVPIAQLARVTLNGGGMSTGKAIAIGIASGAGTFLAILGIFALTFSD